MARKYFRPISGP